MPVYNEADTAVEVLGSVLRLDITDVDLRLIIVESNSADGSREAVLAFRSHPRITILLEEVAHGKGIAVRKGISVSTADILLIQDADLEYDVSDYESLIRPLIDGDADFVLGSRHAESRPMRTFADQPRLAWLMNGGHIAFTRLFNMLFGSNLTDPFTMFKVFRRECIVGVRFHAKRFDFDWELTARIIQRGFSPLEIPVRYKSRSFNEGKKVRLFRDPITWILTSIRCKLIPPGKDRRGAGQLGTSRKEI